MPYKSFVSSTFEDLKAHRAHVIAALRDAGFFVDPMENWTAASQEPKVFSQQRVEGCHLCVLLVARRRGYVPDGESKSITQLEHREAVSHEINVLPFLLSEDAQWPAQFDERDKDPNLKPWREELGKGYGVGFFTHDPSSIKIAPALTRWVVERQARDAAAASANTAAPAAVQPAPLPVPGTTFIGRTGELAELRALFTRDETRLITLLGGPGLGKSRLAIELARELQPAFAGGACWVDLSEQQTIAGITNAVAASFGIRMTGSAQPQETIASVLAGRPAMLLVLDNFEQIVQHAAATVGLWRRRAPEMRFLIASRAVLDVEGETCYWLQPLPDPLSGDPGVREVAANDAVRLFIDRARGKNPHFALDASNSDAVANICHELECHPLSIVLAAERANMFSPQQMLDRLKEKLAFLKSRTETLRETIDWSYQLLKPHEQLAFAQACIFRDGFSIDAAEAVIDLAPAAGAGTSAPPVADAIQELCDQCLLRSDTTPQGEPRFRMFKAIEEFGRSLWGQPRGDESPPPALFQRHAAYFIEYAERHAAQIATGVCREALDRLVLERENILAVQLRALALGDAETAARAMLGFSRSLQARGPAALRVPRLSKSLDALGDRAPYLRARLLIQLSDALWSTGDWNKAGSLADEAAELAEQLAEEGVRAEALLQQARMRNAEGKRPEAIAAFEKARASYAALSDAAGAAACQSGCGHIYDRLGRYDESLACHAEAEKILRELDDPMALTRTLNYYGLTLWHAGRPAEAVERFANAEQINRSLGDLMWVGGNLTNRALALIDLDRYEEALACCVEAGRIHAQLGNKAWAGINMGARGLALREKGDLDEALAALAAAEAIAVDVGDREDIALHAGNRGRTLLKLRRFADARDVLRRAIDIQRQIGGSRDSRFFGNLVALASMESTLGAIDAVRPLVREADELACALGLSTGHPVRRISEDVATLKALLAELDGDAPHRTPKAIAVAESSAELHLHGLTIPAPQVQRIAALIAELKSRAIHIFPWDGLKDQLQIASQTHLPLVGYGSLLSSASAARTISGAAPADARPCVLGFGVRRLFNYEMPASLLTRYGTALDSPARAALNVQVTHDIHDAVNGVLVQVSASDLPALRERERGYDLVPIVCVPWESAVAAEPFVAYVLATPDEQLLNRRWTRTDIEPHAAYLRLCCDAARAVSDEFLNFFFATTFLADGRTAVSQPNE